MNKRICNRVKHHHREYLIIMCTCNYTYMHTINIVYAHEASLVLIVNVHITLCLVNTCEHTYKISNVVAQKSSYPGITKSSISMNNNMMLIRLSLIFLM